MRAICKCSSLIPFVADIVCSCSGVAIPSLSVDCSTMVVAKSVWSYQLGDAYVPMPDQASDGLEELYMQWEKKHAPGQHEVSSGKYKYAVDFGEMTQKNLETGRTRKLQRSQSQCWAQVAALEAEKQDLLSQLGVLNARVLQLESAEEDPRKETLRITSENQQLSEANQRLK